MIESILSAVAPSIIVGIVLFVWESRQKKVEARKKAQEDLRTEGDLMRLDLEVATAQLAYATAMAVKRGQPNGEMEPAIETYEQTMEKFRKFERKQMTYFFKEGRG